MTAKEMLIKKLEKISLTQGIYRSFSDFCALSSAAISANCGNKEMETRYTHLIRQYDEETLNEYMECFALLVATIEEEPFKDILGELYMIMKISAGKMGQFFTAQHISDMCAKISFSKIEIIKKVCTEGIIKISEPCVGGGSMVLGFAKSVADMGLNPQKILFFECNDIDPLCVNMCYVQMSLNGLRASVTRGNGLNGEIIEKHITLAVLEKIEKCNTFSAEKMKSGNKIEQMKFF